MTALKENENLINKKKIKNFLDKKIKSIEIELRAEEFLNTLSLAFLKKTIESGCVFTKYRGGKILQDKDLRVSLFKSIKDSFFGANLLEKTNFFRKKKKKLFLRKKKPKKLS